MVSNLFSVLSRSSDSWLDCVCVCVDTEEWRYHALPKWPECESPIEYGLVHKQWFPTNRRARKEWEKIRGFFPILLYEFFFPTTQNKHQASQIEVKRILNWQNALDIVLTPFVITSSCMHTPPTATAAIAAGHTERLYTLSHSHTQFSSVGCRARQLYSLACSHTINNHHMYFQRGKTLKWNTLKAKWGEKRIIWTTTTTARHTDTISLWFDAKTTSRFMYFY